MSQGAGGVWPKREVTVSKDEARQRGVLLNKEVTLIGPDYSLTNENINKVLAVFEKYSAALEKTKADDKNADFKATLTQEGRNLGEILESTGISFKGGPQAPSKKIDKATAQAEYGVTLKKEVTVNGKVEDMTDANIKKVLQAYQAFSDKLEEWKTRSRPNAFQRGIDLDRLSKEFLDVCRATGLSVQEAP